MKYLVMQYLEFGSHTLEGIYIMLSLNMSISYFMKLFF